ncbi:MAG: nucleoside deaminase [Candidatus Fermentibacteraceae bacterium]|nr:nucleoside deaminase [Candidatus Fermentibacteraceae bacterium]MBN2607800.1 nucleoside deaminase [Candidatus Fermentibacteraceae bacterium]
MKEALEKAREAFDAGEVPVGAILVESSGRFFADRNRTAETGMPTSHAEHLVISAAAEDRGDWRLEGCSLYTTLEPCLMCAGLVILARIPRIIFGAPDKRFGAFGSVTDVLEMPNLNHYPEVYGGCYKDECGKLMKEFFRLGRESGRKN